MINWELADLIRYQKPDGWDESVDGVYGDESALEASCAAGEESLMYLLRLSKQGESLARLTGPIDPTTMEPRPLEELPPEEES